MENQWKDKQGRIHSYLRISLTEKCNLRCTYCMPENGIALSPRSELATAEEIYQLAKIFVSKGVNKIRLTGGEPLVRKDFKEILEKLSQLKVELAITTNAVLVDPYIHDFKRLGLKKINVSLDTLDSDKFKIISRRDLFHKTMQNINLLVQEGFELKLNAVLIKDFNDDEIVEFIKLSGGQSLQVRFIEFMPFDGNNWDKSKVVSEKEIINKAAEFFDSDQIIRLKDRPNDTSRNYKIEAYEGSFAIISSVSNPFCSTCNRLRITANGKMKNCLFSAGETDLLGALRQGRNVEELIEANLMMKHKSRGGMDNMEKLSDKSLHSQNRSMISIGG
tara:strand:+ start:200 stop:1198 length:999 start_codon:yes stop_codon:yes gene_type:complete